MPGFGEAAQERLKASSVLVVGAGGLGSPASLYLAAAGFGRVSLVDGDLVDRSNLHRQVLFSDDDIGVEKVDRASRRLRSLNPDIRIDALPFALTSDNALDVLRAHDLVVDGSDNFPTRYLVNDAAVLAGIPLIYGSVFRFEGQVSVFNHGGGPCYRCLFPEPPRPGAVLDCAEGGVLGALPGIIGSMQAMEAVKVAAGIGDVLSGRMLIFDALSASTRQVSFSRDPECPICGSSPTIRELIDYEAFCGVDGAATTAISASELHQKMEGNQPPYVLDVREPLEREIASIGGTLIPLGELDARVDEVPRDADVVVVCRSGQRSAKAVEMLRERGFARAINLEGGLKAWRRDVDPSMKDY